jgi:hypothetical protein
LTLVTQAQTGFTRTIGFNDTAFLLIWIFGFFSWIIIKLTNVNQLVQKYISRTKQPIAELPFFATAAFTFYRALTQVTSVNERRF